MKNLPHIPALECALRCAAQSPPGCCKDARETIRIATWNCAGLSNLSKELGKVEKASGIQSVANLFMGKCSKKKPPYQYRFLRAVSGKVRCRAMSTWCFHFL